MALYIFTHGMVAKMPLFIFTQWHGKAEMPRDLCTPRHGSGNASRTFFIAPWHGEGTAFEHIYITA